MNWFTRRDSALRWIKQTIQYADQVLESLFQPKLEPKFRWLVWVWVIVLYLLGIYLWGKFLNWGNFSVNYHDWAEVNAARISFVQGAILKGQIPLHMSGMAHLRNITDRYMVLPDAILAPQMVFLAFLETTQLIFVNTLFLYTFATLGLFWFCWKNNLSLFAYAVVFLLFNFNGHILSHMSVGHITWWSYFFFPWIVALFFFLPGPQHEWRWITTLAVLLFLMFLNGGSHQFTWFFLLLAFVGLNDPKRLPLLFKAALFAGLLTAMRLLPPILGMSEFGKFEFLGGYPTSGDLWTALTQVKSPLDVPTAYLLPGKQQLRWWEFDLYIGLVGTAFLLYFGIVRWLKNIDTFPQYEKLFLPTAALVFFSMGDFYELIRRIPFPLFAGERVSARMMSVPFVILLFMAAVCLQHWLNTNRHSTAIRLIQLGLLGIILKDLWVEISQWRVSVVAQIFPVTPVDLTKAVGNHPDTLYVSMVIAGATISLITFTYLVYRTIRERMPS